ncbi:MAG: stage sporulation protein [Clostridiales bacterium]|nr:stage sporulation protein [Clostridiales bacterium]
MKVKKQLLAFVVLTITAVAFLHAGYTPASADTPQLTSGNIIRFHVIANSDSPEDQALKLKVRDRILNELHNRFNSANDINEQRKAVIDNMSYIEAIANDEIKRSGKDYTAKVYFGCYDFPTKVYGEMVFPAGTYEALRVVIGQGEGANWWCVMFPPLCFIDTDHGVAKEATELSPESQPVRKPVDQATAKAQQPDKDDEDTQETEDVPSIKFKFKIAEWWDEAWPGISNIFTVR